MMVRVIIFLNRYIRIKLFPLYRIRSEILDLGILEGETYLFLKIEEEEEDVHKRWRIGTFEFEEVR